MLVGRQPREAPTEQEGNIGCDLVVGQGWERWGVMETKIMQMLLSAVGTRRVHKGWKITVV